MKVAARRGVRVLLVHNPSSGDDDHAAEHLVGLIGHEGHTVDYQSSSDEWSRGLAQRPELIAIAGGDGTVAQVTKTASSHGIPFTILPTGTANNVATWLGLAGVPIPNLIAGWSRGHVEPFDVGSAKGPWGLHRFLESLGVGLLAQLIADIHEGRASHVNEMDRREQRIAAALEVLVRRTATVKPVHCRLRLDERDMSGDYLLVEVLNFGLAGPNLSLAPKAHAADGALDVALVRADERDWLQSQLASRTRDTAKEPLLTVRHARHVMIQCESCAVHVDDELWNDSKLTHWTAEVTLQSRALRFLVPAFTAPMPSERISTGAPSSSAWSLL